MRTCMVYTESLPSLADGLSKSDYMKVHFVQHFSITFVTSTELIINHQG